MLGESRPSSHGISRNELGQSTASIVSLPVAVAGDYNHCLYTVKACAEAIASTGRLLVVAVDSPSHLRRAVISSMPLVSLRGLEFQSMSAITVCTPRLKRVVTASGTVPLLLLGGSY